MKYCSIVDIYENDYGCEGIPDNAEPECIVTFEDSNMARHRITMPEKLIKFRSLEIGSAVTFDHCGRPFVYDNKQEVLYRPALSEELHSISEFVADLFSLEQGIPKEMNYLRDEQKPQWWCASIQGTIIGTVSIFLIDGVYHLGRFCIAEAYRGLHVGSSLMRYALQEIFSQSISYIQMECRDQTVHILQKFGAEITGQPFDFFIGRCTPMELKKSFFKP